MFQSTYPQNMPIGVPGRIADCGFKNTLSPVCLEPIPAAVGVMKPSDKDYAIMLPRANVAVATFSAKTVAANVINGTVNTVAINPVTFAAGSTHEATVDLLIAEIKLVPTVQNAFKSADSMKVYIISTPGVTPAASFAITLGASQPTLPVVTTGTGVFFGVTQSIYNQQATYVGSQGPNITAISGSSAPYYKGQVAPTLTQGRIYVIPEDVVTSSSSVNLRVAANGANTQLGAFTGTADGTNTIVIPATQAVWREGNGAIGGIAVLEINLP